LKTRQYIIIIFYCLIIFSCSKTYNISAVDEKYILLIEDIDNEDINNYEKITKKSGKNYRLTKSITNLNGFFCSYYTDLKNTHNNRISFSVRVAIQSNEARATEMFSQLTSANYLQNSQIDHNIYGGDKIFLSQDESSLYFIFLKLKLVYIVEISGIEIKEYQIRNKLKEKIKYIIMNENEISTILERSY